MNRWGINRLIHSSSSLSIVRSMTEAVGGRQSARERTEKKQYQTLLI